MNKNLASKDKLIVALDLPTFSEMKRVVESIDTHVSTYKVGQQLFTAAGPAVLSYLKGLGKTVFLDLKLHEIPNSAAAAISAAGQHGVDMVTVHASGGSKMMRAAVEAASEFPGMKILALTVVTGLNDADLRQIGIYDRCEAQVVRLAELAQQCGCHGVVASPQEAAILRAVLGAEMLIVTAGIRPAGSEIGDQNRPGTPAEAIRAGASFLVVGRPVVKADDPAQAAYAIIQEIQRGEVGE